MLDLQVQEPEPALSRLIETEKETVLQASQKMIISHGSKRPRQLCKICNCTFSPTTGTAFWYLHTPPPVIANVLYHLVEGMSVRATSRVTMFKVREIQRWLLKAGSQASQVEDHLIQDVDLEHVQLDEMWMFVFKKQKHVVPGRDNPQEMGDAWKWIALAWKSRLRVATHVGKRTRADARQLLEKLRRRSNGNSVLFSTDGLKYYGEELVNFLNNDGQELQGGEQAAKVLHVQVVKSRASGRIVKIEKKSCKARKRNVRIS